MTDAGITEKRSSDYYPGLNYEGWPGPYELACALCAPDNGNISSVAPYLRPYIAEAVTPEGWLKAPDDVFKTPLSLARFHLAYDVSAPVPWRGMGCTPLAIKEEFERRYAKKEEERQALVETQCYLYFIGADDGPIKIGITSNPKSRLRTLQSGYPLKLKILALVPNASLQESVYHERFAELRMEGEWFARHPDILAEIARLPSHLPEASHV